MPPAAVARQFFPPAVALHTVKIACELPDRVGCSLSQGDCAEIARQLVASGVVDGIAVETIRRMVAPHRLKPWRQHAWLSPTVPRDQAFCHAVQTVCDLYTRPLLPHEVVLGVDENTSLQPRPRRAPTLPASPDQPVRVEQEYQRQGALNLFAAFDTRTGQVYGQCHDRQRQAEFIEFWDLLDQQIPPQITRIHVVLDNRRMHKGKQVQVWLATHPRLCVYHPPVHCSWMNQVEQWFSILQRKRLRIANFASKADLRDKLMAFLVEYNQHAHPFKWTPQSVAKILAKSEPALFALAA